MYAVSQSPTNYSSVPKTSCIILPLNISRRIDGHNVYMRITSNIKLINYLVYVESDCTDDENANSGSLVIPLNFLRIIIQTTLSRTNGLSIG